MMTTVVARKSEVAVELERIEELGSWALEDGDSDVLAVCEAAFSGDIAAWNEALDWWRAWSRCRRVE